jgi:hypothetical protein
MMADQLELYVALGDSMSIDRYPSLDLLAESGPSSQVARALHARRGPGAGADLPVGAASLLARNVDVLWPEYAGRDLASVAPTAEFRNVTQDGAMLPDVVEAQLPDIPSSSAFALVTLTVGGNDLLMAYGNSRSISTLERAAGEIMRDYERCVGLIRGRLPRARLVLTTVYDPSDGTGFIPGFHESGPPLPLQVLDRVNGQIRRIATSGPAMALADVHAHFLGHGARAASPERWYWPQSMIEPGARGASEIRGVWLDAAGFPGRGEG